METSLDNKKFTIWKQCGTLGLLLVLTTAFLMSLDQFEKREKEGGTSHYRVPLMQSIGGTCIELILIGALIYPAKMLHRAERTVSRSSTDLSATYMMVPALCGLISDMTFFYALKRMSTPGLAYLSRAAVLPLTMLLSKIFLKTEYTGRMILALSVLIGGIIVAGASNIVSNDIALADLLILAISTIHLGLQTTMQDQLNLIEPDMSFVYLYGVTALWKLAFSFALFPWIELTQGGSEPGFGGPLFIVEGQFKLYGLVALSQGAAALASSAATYESNATVRQCVVVIAAILTMTFSATLPDGGFNLTVEHSVALAWTVLGAFWYIAEEWKGQYPTRSEEADDQQGTGKARKNYLNSDGEMESKVSLLRSEEDQALGFIMSSEEATDVEEGQVHNTSTAILTY